MELTAVITAVLILMAISAFKLYQQGDRNELSNVVHRDGIFISVKLDLRVLIQDRRYPLLCVPTFHYHRKHLRHPDGTCRLCRSTHFVRAFILRSTFDIECNLHSSDCRARFTRYLPAALSSISAGPAPKDMYGTLPANLTLYVQTLYKCRCLLWHPRRITRTKSLV